MEPTIRLDHDDAHLVAFEARVVGHESHAGRPSVVLDRTAFYPEGGGQMADRGTLGERAVVDVQTDDDGVVHHVVEGDRPGRDETVHGTVDPARRRVHRALHTAQHVLSRALWETTGAETVSSRLGETTCTIDVDRADVDEARAARAEDLASSIVADDLPVRAWFPNDVELSTLALRRAPKVEDHVRVVDIGGFDVTPCGGTHCSRTSQIGIVRVVGVERYKGGTRSTFHAGERARTHLAAESDVLRTLAREFSCGLPDVPAAVGKLRRELGAAREELGLVRARASELVAKDLLAGATGSPRVVIATVEGLGPDDLHALAGKITEAPDAVALVAAPAPEGVHFVAQRGADATFDCGTFVKRVAASAGGRGGGRPERAEGRLPPGAAFDALASAALA